MNYDETEGELQTAITTVTMHTLADLPSALIDDVCFGMATLPDTFEKYGFTVGTAEVFRGNAMFKRLVSVRAAELDKEGITHRVRAGMVADAALGELAKRVTDPNATVSFVLDTYKVVAKNAGYEPKGAEAQAVSGFSVNIILPGMPGHVGARVPQHATIDVTPVFVPVENDAEFEVI